MGVTLSGNDIGKLEYFALTALNLYGKAIYASWNCFFDEEMGARVGW